MEFNEENIGAILPPASNGLLKIPGITAETKKKVTELLQKNHIDYDGYFHDFGLHNHISHHLLSIYSLGGRNETLERTFRVGSSLQRPISQPIDANLTEENWTSLLGEIKAYSSYMLFFHKVVKKEGAVKAVEKYCFGKNNGHSLLRLMGLVYHPLIHIGFGIEFGIDAQVVEGLAQMATTTADGPELFEEKWPYIKYENDKMPLDDDQGCPPSFSRTAEGLQRDQRKVPRKGVSAFEVVNDILNDDRLAAGKTNSLEDLLHFPATCKNSGDIIKQYCEKWIVDQEGGWKEIVEKAEELFFLTTVMVAANTRPGYKYKQDFFMIHSATSVLFLPSLLEVLCPSSRIALLHAHFRVTIGYWVSRGRPYLHIKDTLMEATDRPLNPIVREAKESIPDSMKANVWVDIIDNAVHHLDEHATKLLRAYIYAGTYFGETAPGAYKCSLPESELIDGTIFARASGMVFEALGYPSVEYIPEWYYMWDRDCSGYDEVWENWGKREVAA